MEQKTIKSTETTAIRNKDSAELANVQKQYVHQATANNTRRAYHGYGRYTRKMSDSDGPNDAFTLVL